jgi:hypothetical protein
MLSSRSAHLRASFVVATSFFVLSCGGSVVEPPTLPDPAWADSTDAAAIAASSSNVTSSDAEGLSAACKKVKVCHRKGKGKYKLITISEKALPAHMAHGDKPESFCSSAPPPPPAATCPCFTAQEVDSYPWQAPCGEAGVASYVCDTNQIAKFCAVGNNETTERLYLTVDAANGQCLASGTNGPFVFQENLSTDEVQACLAAIQNSSFYRGGCQ